MRTWQLGQQRENRSTAEHRTVDWVQLTSYPRKGDLQVRDRTSIRILEGAANQRGDLFARLMGDFFLALGYDECRFNIHKAGREIDIEANHRIENRRMVAECKATKSPVGGADTNKFVGSLDAEQRRDPARPVTGYFVSLAGFTETAIEQEKDLGGARFVPADAHLVVKELIDGHIIVPKEKAAEHAGRCASAYPRAQLERNAVLLAHQIGWIWLFYFTEGKERKYFALIHADGEVLNRSLADEVVRADQSVDGHLYRLTFLASPDESEQPSDQALEEVRSHYFNHLAQEYGHITLEGLPADQDVGSRQLKAGKPLRAAASYPYWEAR